MMHDWSGSMSGWGWTWMALALLAFAGLSAAGIVVAARYPWRRENPRAIEPPVSPKAENLLAERFARGEIDEDDYWQRVHALRAAERQ